MGLNIERSFGKQLLQNLQYPWKTIANLAKSEL